MARTAHVERSTKETRITVALNIDGANDSSIDSGIGFFDHLLDALQRHAGFDLQLKAEGDLHVDGHHTVEDVGIALGTALLEAIGDARGVARFGHAYCPMDESLARAVVDISGRPFLHYDCAIPLVRVGDFDGELFAEFLRALAMNARMALHVELLYGANQHHAMEAMMKATARALKMALAIDGGEREIPSTKGVLI
ncbi:imidazoleglycerol-phosphate dehydratase HisB [candidate division KSB1 bacterium]|nr:imidazoleglycerol-phosphate dehydratase HisB [candidate division KSB1 bacterium]RQW03815.1 MAG: imidazoleglycerol-phosphate dehydratase HisB [candidate division KSB1 bacterium]